MCRHARLACLLSSLRQQGGRVRWDDAGLDIVGREGIAEDRYHTHTQLCRRLETLAAKGAASQVRGDQARHGRDESGAWSSRDKQTKTLQAHMAKGPLDMATSVRIPGRGAGPDGTPSTGLIRAREPPSTVEV